MSFSERINTILNLTELNRSSSSSRSGGGRGGGGCGGGGSSSRRRSISSICSLNPMPVGGDPRWVWRQNRQ